MKNLMALGLISISLAAFSQTVPKADIQIKTAILAAPTEQREKAMVYGYNDKGEFIVLQKGSNELVCLSDDPAQPGFSVSCYHKDLDAFMARGRELKKQGKDHQQIFEAREAEVKSGKLTMPKQPATLYSFSAADDKYNRETGEVLEGYLRYVIYIPYATAESTGLPLKPDAPGMPWIMDPGTHRAHIMINPAPKN
jgi:hypothetical protein